MIVHRQIEQCDLTRGVLTIGAFDGVHRAHQYVIDQTIKMAQSMHVPSTLITFEPHPRKVIYSEDIRLGLLTDLDEKLNRLERTGLDHVVVYPFTWEFSQQSAEEYLDTFLYRKFNPKGIVIGFDHKFGLNRLGDFQLLKNYFSEKDTTLIEIPKRILQNIKISSTQIREYLDKGAIREANELLGYRYTLNGEVIKGNNIGSRLGFPTANIKLHSDDKLIPRSGIYASYVYIDNVPYKGLLYIGAKPSLEVSDHIYIEVHVEGFSGYLYGESIRLELVEFIRPDEKFENLEMLQQNMKSDQAKILTILSNENASST